MCMYDGGDIPATVYRITEITARKEHDCSECGRKIMPRERYRRTFGVWEGKVSVFKTCPHCSVAQNWLAEECGGYFHEMVLEDIGEHVMGAGTVFDTVTGYGSGPARLVIGMRRKWKRRFSDRLMPMPKIPAITAHK